MVPETTGGAAVSTLRFCCWFCTSDVEDTELDEDGSSLLTYIMLFLWFWLSFSSLRRDCVRCTRSWWSKIRCPATVAPNIAGDDSSLPLKLASWFIALRVLLFDSNILEVLNGSDYGVMIPVHASQSVSIEVPYGPVPYLMPLLCCK